MELVSSILIGILGSVVASIIIIYSMYNVRPKISISKEIAYGKNDDGDTTFKIKVINESKRNAIDLSAELFLVRPFNLPDGVGNNLTSLPLKTPSIMELLENGKVDRSGDFNFNFITYEDLKKLWGDNGGKYLLFRIKATNSLSNHTSVFSQVYYKQESSLVHGCHKDGNSMIIVKYS